MKILKKWRSRLMVLAVGLVMVVVFSTAISSATVEKAALEPFYGVSTELGAELKQIAFKDARFYGIVQGNEDLLTIGDYKIQDKDYDLAVGVRLKEDTTQEEFLEWVKNGRQDSDIIDEYVGILNIGYNDRYHLVFDLQKSEVKEIHQEIGYRSIPELTSEEKQQALDIAFADDTMQYILQGKEYEIGKIGVWHSGDTKFGAIFEVVFDEPYFIDSSLPSYNKEPNQINGEVESLIVSVHLTEERVATIIALIAMPVTY